MMNGERPLRFGFIALNDAATLIVARTRGLFAAEGLDVELVREVSWATIRDKLNVGALDGAHMLAPLALATSIGAAGAEPTPLVAPLVLNLNGPAITLASRLAGAAAAGGQADGLARLIARRRDEGASPITLAVVFPFSTHNYLLRDWLARAGVDPDRDVRLAVAPPSRMTGLLVEGVVEGFCVTEPWDTAAVKAGAGLIVARGSQLWPRTPDKVFAVAEAWAARHPETLQALLRAMIRAAAWADEAGNRAELAALLAQPRYVGADAATIEESLADMVFHADGASAPEPAHAGWLLSQMMRWAHVGAHIDIGAVARRVYRPDLYATAAAAVGAAVPARLETLEGYGDAGVFSLATARDHAVSGRMSRIPTG
ncbi:CmpA/NrtA family ABC transporter substrate-binding protein [Phenylobacterium sp.]|uniref:CmpA/NrtA family ABC transporter substrate-binding protein n=1 Tax=Phenylobacterium sp. TaxID=1871053 RepID=UPI0025D61D2E|nr:CmpA/NrtA family ABC transporter substrate-binding protein [Phenylobacterium sp.]